MLGKRHLKRDLSALALLALAAFLGLALANYHPGDPPSDLFHPPQGDVVNACGRYGAMAADLLLRWFGVLAYVVVASAAALALWLLARRPISEPALRMFGAIVTLAGVATVVSLAAPSFTLGPAIGPGGFLGAAGRGLLQMHFASTGALVIAVSLVCAGLLLSTDYVLPRFAARSARVGVLVLRTVGGRLRGRRRAAAVVAAPETPAKAKPAAEEASSGVRIRKKKAQAVEEAEPEAKPQPAPTKSKKSKAEPQEAEEVADEAEEENEVEKPGIAERLASALRIKNKATKKSEREEVIEELEAAIRTDGAGQYELPPLDLLQPGEDIAQDEHEKEVRQKAKMLEKTFASFGFEVKVVEIETGPVIAQYEVELEAGLRLSKITGLADDLAIALRVPSVRIVAPIPGKNTVGIEVPNATRQLVRLREVIEECNGKDRKMRIPVYLGKDVSGNPMLVDLTTLPHLLIAGRTGTGKSVCLNSIILSMLMTRRPDEVRMLMIDPKMVELSPYKKLPHLMHPVVTDMRKAEAILAWAVEKMEERYALLARAGVRHISVYNQLGEEELMDRLQPEDDEQRKEIPLHLPYIVIVADEMADLMMTAGKEVEQHIIRLAQKSRAVGIHLILATQKPTVDVITGLIKSNLPARIAFQVASRTDSRVVLDEMGADKLLGNGDMLFLWPGTSTLLRGQGAYCGDDEINRVVDFVGTSEPEFVKELVQLKAGDGGEMNADKIRSRDELYEAALDIVVREGRGSCSLLQRALGIGYGRAARLIDFMAEDGIVGEYNGSQARDVLITVEQLAEMLGGEAPPEPPAKAKRNKILPEKAEEEEDAPFNELEDGEEESDEDEAGDDEEPEEFDDAEDQLDESAADEEESEEAAAEERPRVVRYKMERA